MRESFLRSGEEHEQIAAAGEELALGPLSQMPFDCHSDHLQEARSGNLG